MYRTPESSQRHLVIKVLPLQYIVKYTGVRCSFKKKRKEKQVWRQICFCLSGTDVYSIPKPSLPSLMASFSSLWSSS